MVAVLDRSGSAMEITTAEIIVTNKTAKVDNAAVYTVIDRFDRAVLSGGAANKKNLVKLMKTLSAQICKLSASIV